MYILVTVLFLRVVLIRGLVLFLSKQDFSKMFKLWCRVIFFFLTFFVLEYRRENNRIFIIREIITIKCVYRVDFFSSNIIFLLCFVGRLIIWYSVGFYFYLEPDNGKFYLYLMFFWGFIFILVMSKSLIFILIRWERVGIMSFFLIRWWYGRSESIISSIQAVLYNRVGDFRIYLVVLYGLVWGMDLTLRERRGFRLGGFLIRFRLRLAILTKSSQFVFHPWLPNAIERPTPVSSLLHSSTMVVAGVFIYIRVERLVDSRVNKYLILMGGLTMVYRGFCSMRASDVKKVIAFSTTSQLRFIIMSVRMVGPFSAFFLLLMHSFFKSLLFLRSGVLIHGINRDQSIFKMKRVWTISVLTKYSFTVASLSLMRFPFFCRFFSKDFLIENIWGLPINRLFLWIYIFGCVLTVGYTFRSLFLLEINLISKVRLLRVQEKLRSVFSWVFGLRLRSAVFGMLYFFVFFLIEEEFLSTMYKMFPCFILVRGVLFSYNYILRRSVILRNYIFFYNPLFHRSLCRWIGMWREKIVVYEFYWMEWLLMVRKNSILVFRQPKVLFSVAGLFMYVLFSRVAIVSLFV